ncbi:hypothetical protein [Spirosoma foliorum]|uniref:Uncharacterized protein n=1 Tax=Spirosoma foliorum TaxID=2710596 RepID=A0A7G5GS76_9BACT|nr:hypothetical protein [Spirosoma foliorum]QMW01718.1 hypothetical protein H3H32_27775 [Spirosoma foliorum]
MKRVLRTTWLSRKTWLISIVVLVCSAISYPLLFDPIVTTFNITANTERIEIQTVDENGSHLNFYDADIYDTGTNPIFKKFTGSLKLNKGVAVTIERTAYGPAILQFNAPKNQIIGSIFDENSQFVRHTSHFLQIFISNIKSRAENGQTIILPVDGVVNIGRSVDFETPDESTAVLRSGEINMTGKSTFTDTFEAGTNQLYLGDQITFDDKNNKAFGFITINEQPCMQAAYRVIAKQATILKPGPKTQNSGVDIQATKFDRLSKASPFQIISLIFGALGFLTSLFTFLKDNNLIKGVILSWQK